MTDWMDRIFVDLSVSIMPVDGAILGGHFFSASPYVSLESL